MFDIEDYEDAKHQLDLVFTYQHLKQVKPRDPQSCVGFWGITALPNIVNAKVGLEYTWVTLKSAKIIKYKNNAAMRRIVELNDLKTKAEIIRHFKKMMGKGEAVVASLLPILPGSVRSKVNMRSEVTRQRRRESAARSQEKRRNGIPKRKYTSPSERGLRNLIGLSHSWSSV